MFRWPPVLGGFFRFAFFGTAHWLQSLHRRLSVDANGLLIGGPCHLVVNGSAWFFGVMKRDQRCCGMSDGCWGGEADGVW